MRDELAYQKHSRLEMAGFGDQTKKMKSTPQRNMPMKGEDLNDMALDHHVKGDLHNAEKFYREAIKAHCMNSSVFSNLGVICKNSGRSEEAILLYRKAIEIKPNNPDAYSNLGSLQKDLGRLDQALASTLKSLELKLDNPIAHMNLGGIYLELGQLNQALASTLKSLELKPDNPIAHMNLGSIYQSLSQLDQAVNSNLKSLELKPDNPIAHMNLGSIYKDLGQLKQALASTLKSLDLKQDNPTALMNLGSIYKELGLLDQALVSTLKSLEIKSDNPDAHMNLGSIYKQMNDFRNAEKEVDIAIKLDASRLDICLRIKAACLFQKQEYDNAIGSLKQQLTGGAYTEKSIWESEVAIMSTIYAKKHTLLHSKALNYASDKKGRREDKDYIIRRSRNVEEDLLKELISIDSKELRYATDARNGEGCCTNFQLFDSKLQSIQRLERDLMTIASESLSMEIASLKYDSFFNTFNKKSGTVPHNHINTKDNDFNLWEHKYSLVYYLDPGDQDGEYPGILQLHEPDIQILPEKGMIVIMPATRIHSSYYEGTKSRLMVGANFYAFSDNWI